MVREIRKNGRGYFACSECNLVYRDGDTAKSCESWCKRHNSCNLDIIKKSVRI